MIILELIASVLIAYYMLKEALVISEYRHDTLMVGTGIALLVGLSVAALAVWL